MAEVYAAEAGDHGKGGAFQPADEVAGDVAAATLQGDKEDVVDIAVNLIAQSD